MFNFINHDLYRYTKSIKFKALVKNYFLSPGFNYIFWFRLASKYKNPIFKYLLFRKMVKYGIEIHTATKIGKGFYIGHWGGIVINPKAVIGENCNISQGVTIGIVNSGPKKGVPTIGDRVYIGPGAKVIGDIKIGNNVAIGANAVVINDVPDGVTVGGIPAKVISQNDSSEYINKVWNDK
jgi:serine O-acetyltransferase